MAKAINITNGVDNETVVENIIFDWLSNEENIQEPGKDPQRNFARQYPLGNKRTDFTTLYRDEKGPVCIIIECKNKSKDHSTGEEQVKGYMETVKNHNNKLNIIGVTASLTPKKNLKLTAFWQIGDEIKEIKAKADIKYLVSQTRKDEEGISKKRAKIASWKETLGKELSQLHNYVRNYCKAPANEKVNLINGVFIALRSNDFRKNMNKYQDVAYSRTIYNTIISVMMAESHDSAQIQYIKDSFAFLNIETHPTNDPDVVPSELLNDVNITGTVSFNKFICNYVTKNILEPLERDPELKESSADIASVVYNEFIRYAKGDGKDLGIVLTPEHICDLMTEILDLQPEDILLDTCTGTGAFLISGMKKKIEHSVNGSEENKSVKGLIGVEFQPHMYALLTANMLFNNADISQIYLGSCFDENIINNVKKLNPTKSIMNPPYGMKEKGYNELDFVLNALKLLPDGGKLVVIMPTTCGIKSNTNVNELKEEILKNNTLDAIIKMDPKLFKEKASTATSIYVFTAGVPNNKPTMFIDGSSVVFSKVRSQLIDSTGKWNDLKNNILNDLKTGKTSSISKYYTLSNNDSWEYPEEYIFELHESDFMIDQLKEKIIEFNNFYNF